MRARVTLRTVDNRHIPLRSVTVESYSTVTVSEAPEDAISNSRSFKAYISEVTKHVLVPQVFSCNQRHFHWDCIIYSAVLPPCALFMKLRSSIWLLTQLTTITTLSLLLKNVKMIMQFFLFPHSVL